MSNAQEISSKLIKYLKSPYSWWFLLLFTSSVLVLSTVGDYGLSWDEVFRFKSGESKIAYYEKLLEGDWESANALRSQTDHYPGMVDISVNLLRRVSPLDFVTTGHLIIAVFGLWGVLGTMFIGRELGGPWAGLCAGCLLLGCSRYWGHMFINPKDIPFAGLFVWGVWAMYRSIYSTKEFDLRWAVYFGVSAGLAMSVRVGGLLLFCYIGLFFLIRLLAKIWKKEYTRKEKYSYLVRLTLWIFIAAIPAFLLMFLFLPRLHANPFGATTSAVEYVSKFGWQGVVLFEGNEYSTNELPWYYLIKWLSVGLPDLWLILTLGTLAVATVEIIKTGKYIIVSNKGPRVGILVFSIIFPVVFIIVNQSNVYDGFRHILFIVPLIASLLAFALIAILMKLRREFRVGIGAIVVIVFAIGLIDQINLHPYQYTYINRMSGGIEKNYDKFDLEYWGTSYKEAVEFLIEYIEENRNAYPVDTGITIAMYPPHERIFEKYETITIPPPGLVIPYLSKNLKLVEPAENPNFFIAMSRNGFVGMIPGETIYSVNRKGVEFARVTKNESD